MEVKEYPAIDRMHVNAMCKQAFFNLVQCPLPIIGKGLVVNVEGQEPYCAIVYLKGCPDERRHERAHCNGWAH